MRHDIAELKMLQALPLDVKIEKTKIRIKEWVDRYGIEGVYISFSGGKDSTVLLHIVREMYPSALAVFVNTGLEYPSIRKFALSFDNVVEVRPSMNFRDVIIKYGYPMITKNVAHNVDIARRNPDGNVMKNIFDPNKHGMYAMHTYSYLLDAPFLISDKCCNQMKKRPLSAIQKTRKPIIATTTEESSLRKDSWLHSGCNAFDLKKPQSRPMSFWTEQDILKYIKINNISIAEPYKDVVRVYDKDVIEGQMDLFDLADKLHCDVNDFNGIDIDCTYKTTGCTRTGCIFCGFGITRDKNRFLQLAKDEPELCSYVMRGGHFNKKGLWEPTSDGLGYWFVLKWINKYGKHKIGIPNDRIYSNVYSTPETDKYF